jgi:hypothetical protein
MFPLVPKYVTDVTNEQKLRPLQFRVPLVSNWLSFKLLQFETKVAERALRVSSLELESHEAKKGS